MGHRDRRWRRRAPPAHTCGPWSPSAGLTPGNGVVDVGTTRVDSARITWALYVRSCGDVTQYTWIPQLRPDQLAPIARDEVTKLLPRPTPAMSPDFLHRRENPFTLVRLPTYFAVPAAQWAPVTAMAQIPGLVVTATATPTSLVFDPGEPGGKPVACAGPGELLRATTDVAAASRACSYEYHHASSIAGGTFTATLTITWEITWTSSAGASGVLTAASTSSALPVPVREVQALVTQR